MAKSRSPRRRPPAPEAKTARQHELDTRRRGALSEHAFVYKAASLGFGVAKPYDTERFDFILISHDPPERDKLWRVQVKATARLSKGSYPVSACRRAGGGRGVYLPSEIDFLVAHVIPDDSWFIFPIHAITSRRNLILRPKNTRRPGGCEAYREAWHLLRRPQ